MTKGITTHTVVVNEEQWIWYAINSVLPHVDKMLIFDMGSTDKTVEIIKSIQSPKLVLEEYGPYDTSKSVILRNKLIEMTKTEWILILDGDEVWYDKSIKTVVSAMKTGSPDLWGIVTPTINFLGDIYHVEEPNAGKYEFAGKKGHLGFRAIRNFPGMKVLGIYPLEGYYKSDGFSISSAKDNMIFLNEPYCHMTNLMRSSSTQIDKTVFQRRLKREIGIKVSSDFKYPEIFDRNRPKFVPAPWLKMTAMEKFLAGSITPLKRIRRRLF